eukprot:CAMPEP_0170555890 /NCGR_PEP_ID=MMETSP0211-20121228/14555_1 /TAXON_ID=311385 /ORGANISM="Pseudokeronopsis sp., Strain OXSARD2" /LENGTH=43 /DNA_ID= /DNA_START= /DNA_END= /DNA_ORIENTATION=
MILSLSERAPALTELELDDDGRSIGLCAVPVEQVPVQSLPNDL